MAASQATLGYGSVVQIATEASPDVYASIDEVTNVTPPQSTLDQIDVSHMQSPNRRREYISGMTDSGDFVCEGNFVPGSATDDRLFELLNLPTGQSRRRSLRCSFPNGSTWTFDGELTGYEIAVPFDDKMTFTATWKVTGDITRGST